MVYETENLIGSYNDNYDYVMAQMQPQENPTYNLSESCKLDGDYDAVFIYSDSCGYCAAMKPYVNASEYNWYWANVAEDEWFLSCAQEVGYSGCQGQVTNRIERNSLWATDVGWQ